MDARERLTALLEEAKRGHEKYYADQEWDHEAMPMYFLANQQGIHTMMVLADFPEEGAAKIELANKIGQYAKEHGMDAYVFNCESWTIPQGAARNPGQRFSSRDDRIEILVVEARLDTQEAAMCHAKIIRQQGVAPRLEWQQPMFSMDKGSEIHSRLNIFRPGEIPDPEFPDNSDYRRQQAIQLLMERLLGPR